MNWVDIYEERKHQEGGKEKEIGEDKNSERQEMEEEERKRVKAGERKGEKTKRRKRIIIHRQDTEDEERKGENVSMGKWTCR